MSQKKYCYPQGKSWNYPSSSKYPFGEPDHENKIRRFPKDPPHPELIKNMRMTYSVYNNIKETIGSKPAETGGMLLSETHDYTITIFIFDIAASNNRNVYQPNTNFLNKALVGRNEDFVGIAHSHPPGILKLTPQDKVAAWSNITSPSNTHLRAYLMPLIRTIPDTGHFEIIPYIVTCHPKGMGEVIVHEVELEILS